MLVQLWPSNGAHGKAAVQFWHFSALLHQYDARPSGTADWIPNARIGKKNFYVTTRVVPYVVFAKVVKLNVAQLAEFFNQKKETFQI